MLAVASLILLAGALATNAQDYTQQEEVEVAEAIEAQDSAIDVIGYFSKGDTLDYWIYQTSWKVSPTDSVLTAGVNTKVRLVVTDSTSTGYKMDYTFLEVKNEESANDGMGRLMNALVDRLGKKIVDTTIKFQTDELGTITKFDNLGQIRRQAKSLHKATIKELMQIPEVANLKKDYNIDIEALASDVEADKLVDGYLEELKRLFVCHGLSYEIGDFQLHEEATDSTYESETYTSVSFDPSDYTYSIHTNVVNIIPQSALKDMIGSIVGMFANDSISASFNENFDSQVDEDAMYESYFGSDFLSTGWPYRVVEQSGGTVKGYGKVKQTYISLDYINY